ncbi:hypothetical protein QWZ08_11510 [Ferruginibacter paludis]|uniref:hypothetical protein n=1 Tax=Ferruginibacter paludis TaxID=1310417 RepID=UPI0025B2B772|nr:hypothetical protein [Ferruginibacter paludis]MDN3656259.1 hypothetical protein [Ferruginibacter paludis]
MKAFFFIIALSSIGAIILFAYMRNRLAHRNVHKRQRMEEKIAEIIEHLQQYNSI